MKAEQFREWVENLGNVQWTPLKAIKAKCVECCAGEGDPTKCEIKTCPLYWFLLQHKREKEARPKRVMSDEERARRIELCRVAREKRGK